MRGQGGKLIHRRQRRPLSVYRHRAIQRQPGCEPGQHRIRSQPIRDPDPRRFHQRDRACQEPAHRQHPVRQRDRELGELPRQQRTRGDVDLTVHRPRGGHIPARGRPIHEKGAPQQFGRITASRPRRQPPATLALIPPHHLIRDRDDRPTQPPLHTPQHPNHIQKLGVISDAKITTRTRGAHRIGQQPIDALQLLRQ